MTTEAKQGLTRNEIWQTHMRAEIAINHLLNDLVLRHKQSPGSIPNPYKSHKGKDDEPLRGALDNLSLINSEIPPEVKQALGFSESVVELKPPLFSLRRFFNLAMPPDGSLIYFPKDSRLLFVPPTKDPKPVPVTSEMLHRYWSGNTKRNLVKTLGELSFDQILDQFRGVLQTSTNKFI